MDKCEVYAALVPIADGGRQWCENRNDGYRNHCFRSGVGGVPVWVVSGNPRDRKNGLSLLWRQMSGCSRARILVVIIGHGLMLSQRVGASARLFAALLEGYNIMLNGL